MQTIGRAARNIQGTAILYADRMTGSMQRAIDETERRRRKQMEFNTAHNITPRSVQKAVRDIMEGAHAGAPDTPRHFAKVAEEVIAYESLTAAQLGKKLAELEKRMYQHARDLEFEDAARLRDQIQRLGGKIGV